MKWTEYDKEFYEEMETVRVYGGPLSKRLPRCDDTYKAQALRLLAVCEQLKDKILELEKHKAAAVDVLDGITAEALSRENGMGVEWNDERLARMRRVSP